MRIVEYKCKSEYSNVKYVLKNILRLSTAFITKLKQSSGILLNDSAVTVLAPVKSGDTIKLVVPYFDSPDIESSDIPIDILYEDDDLICINKPCGMPTHPSVGHHGNTLMNAALFYLRKTKDEFHVVTRLDRYTSGIVLAAKNQFSASIMCTAHYNSSISKKYVGVCRGKLPDRCGTIEQPISRCTDSIIKRCVSEDGKYAKTTYKVLEYIDNKSLVEFTLHTGRTHQIRVHASFIGNPLLNDFLYDANAIDSQIHKLHCGYIEFNHPYTGERISVNAPIPNDFI